MARNGKAVMILQKMRSSKMGPLKLPDMMKQMMEDIGGASEGEGKQESTSRSLSLSPDEASQVIGQDIKPGAPITFYVTGKVIESGEGGTEVEIQNVSKQGGEAEQMKPQETPMMRTRTEASPS
jgi:hypothetical protein